MLFPPMIKYYVEYEINAEHDTESITVCSWPTNGTRYT